MKQESERRSYYRINDLVGLTYKVLDDSTTAEPLLSDNLGLSVTSLLAEIDLEFNQAINILWQENPTAAKAFGLLNKKLSMIAAHSLQGEEQEGVDSYEEMMTSISGCGIAFDCNECIPTGARLQLLLVLKPSNTQLHLTGEVVATNDKTINSDKPFSVRLNFDKNNSAQEQLIQHIVQKQCSQSDSKS